MAQPQPGAAIDAAGFGANVTINQAAGQADPTSSTPVRFDVVFNEAVTGYGALYQIER